ncbi:MAG TPA: hypothetical protein VIJ99_02825 [Acidimicrobiales bacterium]
MKKMHLTSWIVTMLISLGTFAGVLTAMGTLNVPVSSTVAAPAQTTTTPGTSSTTPSTSTSHASTTPVSLTSPPSGGGDDTTSSSSSAFVHGSDN